MTITNFLNPTQRRTAYFIYAALGLLVGGTQVVLAIYGMADVKWFLAATAVYGFLGTSFGFVAAANTGEPVEEAVAPPQATETDLSPEDAETADIALVNDVEPEVEPDEEAATLGEPVETNDEVRSDMEAEADANAEVDVTPTPDGYEPRH